MCYGFPGGGDHALTFQRPVELRTLYFAPHGVALPPWEHCVVLAIPPLLRELIVALVDLPWTACGDGSAEHMMAVLRDRLCTLEQDPVHLPEPRAPRGRAFATRARDRLAEELSIVELCKGTGASQRTLERVFRRETGLSIGAWYQQLRLVTALEHLAQGESVSAVAFAVGYENPSSFIAAFKRAFGTTPRRYFAL